MKKSDIQLEKQAFESVFKSIVADLSLCPANCASQSSSNRVLNSYSSIIASTRLRDPKFVRDLTRQRLDQTLVGVVSENVRARLVESFRNSFFSPQVNLRPSAFLSCILDQSFEKLEVVVTDPGFSPDLDVIPVIAKYSPLLRNLELDFSICSDSSREEFSAVLRSLSLLTELKELALKNIPEAFDNELTLIGESCPKLEVLKLGPSLVPVEILGGIVTRQFEKLKEAFRSPLPDVRVLDGTLNPFCDTLKCLDFEGTRTQDYNRAWNPDMAYGVAVILRNVPNLEFLKLSNLAVPEAVQLLWNGADANKSHLKLKELLMVKLHDEPTLEAITELCPHLESISFVDGRDYSVDSSKPVNSAILNALGKLTKVEKVSFKDVDSRSLASVIRVWSRQLTTLRVTGNVNISLDTLATCVNLTEFSSSMETKFELPPNFDAKQPFLPKLMKVSISHCLFAESGETSVEQLLLLKPSLKHVKLECCHLADTSEGWEKVFRQWRGLESLQIRSARGLDGKLVWKLLRWMPKLKEIILPALLRNSKEVRPQLSALRDMWKTVGVSLEFESFQMGTTCRSRPSPQLWEPSDAEDDAENWGDVVDDDDDDDDNHFFGGHYGSDPYDDYDDHDPWGMDDYDDYSDFDYEFGSGDEYDWNPWAD